jgi:hypothetical protein
MKRVNEAKKLPGEQLSKGKLQNGLGTIPLTTDSKYLYFFRNYNSS